MQLKSIRFKTSLLYSSILLGILILYNIFLFVSIRSILIKDIDDELEIKAKEISNILQAYEKIKNISSHPLSILESLLHKKGFLPNQAVIIDELWRSQFETLKLNQDYINIINSKGQTLIHSSNVTSRLHALFLRQFGFSQDKAYWGTVRQGTRLLRAINLPFSYKKNLPLTIQVATSLNHVYQFLIKFMVISSTCILLILAITSFLGSFFVKRILAPVVKVTKTADTISHKDLSTRISVKDMDIEMQQLITSFNAMIERLEKSFTHINEFNSYVAHELKTPLAIVKGELELALEQTPKGTEEGKILSSCLDEINRMIRITKDLLLLAKLDYKPQILKFEQMKVKPFLEEINDHGVLLSAEKKITFISGCHHLNKNLTISADKVHLRRLFLNIITNAIKYTPEGGQIHLSAKSNKTQLNVDIADTGEGIADENIHRIFDKFFRVDKMDRPRDIGFGLGLSIARSIAKAHQGDIQVQSKLHEGTTFTITLPLARS